MFPPPFPDGICVRLVMDILARQGYALANKHLKGCITSDVLPSHESGEHALTLRYWPNAPDMNFSAGGVDFKSKFSTNIALMRCTY